MREKPHGIPIVEPVAAADKAIETGNLDPLKELVSAEKVSELEERFNRVLSLKEYDVNDVEEGREYVEDYVMFFKFADRLPGRRRRSSC